MHRLRYLAIIVLCAAGCKSFTSVKVDNPVASPAPPRVVRGSGPAAEAFARNEGSFRSADESGDIQPAEFQPALKDKSIPYTGSEVVAKVNGSPIFADDIFEPYSEPLARARRAVAEGKATKRELRMVQDKFIKDSLAAHIERRLLVDTLKKTLKAEQIDMLKSYLQKDFEPELKRIKKELNVATDLELEDELAKHGTSIAKLRENYESQQMGMQYLIAKAKKPPKLGRPELLAYYREHREDYKTPEKVRWQRIVVRFDKHGGQRGAFDRMLEAVDALRSTPEPDFSAVAREFSDDPTAKSGGQWDWTDPASLADRKVQTVLHEQAVGVISEIIEGPDSFSLIKINDRKLESYASFESVQDELEKKLTDEARQAAVKEALAELKAAATIETYVALK